jgi:hypothetical protein
VIRGLLKRTIEAKMRLNETIFYSDLKVQLLDNIVVGEMQQQLQDKLMKIVKAKVEKI